MYTPADVMKDANDKIQKLIEERNQLNETVRSLQTEIELARKAMIDPWSLRNAEPTSLVGRCVRLRIREMHLEAVQDVQGERFEELYRTHERHKTDVREFIEATHNSQMTEAITWFNKMCGWCKPHITERPECDTKVISTEEEQIKLTRQYVRQLENEKKRAYETMIEQEEELIKAQRENAGLEEKLKSLDDHKKEIQRLKTQIALLQGDDDITRKREIESLETNVARIANRLMRLIQRTTQNDVIEEAHQIMSSEIIEGAEREKQRNVEVARLVHAVDAFFSPASPKNEAEVKDALAVVRLQLESAE